MHGRINCTSATANRAAGLVGQNVEKQQWELADTFATGGVAADTSSEGMRLIVHHSWAQDR
jgi:hypothetical protein